MKGFYQPAGIVGLVSWAWILMVGLFALIMQLEVTHFNEWTALALIVFVALVIFAILRRGVEIDEQGFIHFYQLFSVQRLSIRISGMKNVQFTKRGLLFTYNGDQYYYLVSKNVRTTLQKSIGE
ncbi:MAG: EbsA family protein [Lactobacillaceae bacterium]|jgi:hypothetical protein|nr:EbsA family protein [Lactobacillaceae bacterium]